MILLCAWCPDIEMTFSKVLDDVICPDCRGCDCIERPILKLEIVK